MAQGMLSRAEVAAYLSCDTQTIDRLIQKKELTLYRVGGVFERFEKGEVMRLKLKTPPRPGKLHRGIGERIVDFWRYNNFYIATFSVLALVVFFFYFFRH